jgi:dienelactone hydrolase
MFPKAAAASLATLFVVLAATLLPAWASAPRPAARQASPPAVGIRVVRLIDTTRTIRLPGGHRAPRTLLTYVRYPAIGAPGATDLPNAPVADAQGRLPLIVFVHGFAVTPGIYSHLLQAWARAGFVVASPVFPLESAGAPGGPDESDLVNEPSDVSFVISQLLAASADASALAGAIDGSRIAVAGQSDGGEAALAAAYSRSFRDPRIGAAVILSGARMSGVGGYGFGPGSAPLLAIQGTADPINEPRYTYAYFRSAHRPKFLLRLLGAEHLPPYTTEQPQLGTVERVSIAFLDTFFRPQPAALQHLLALGTVPRVASLQAEP